MAALFLQGAGFFLQSGFDFFFIAVDILSLLHDRLILLFVFSLRGLFLGRLSALCDNECDVYSEALLYLNIISEYEV